MFKIFMDSHDANMQHDNRAIEIIEQDTPSTSGTDNAAYVDDTLPSTNKNTAVAGDTSSNTLEICVDVDISSVRKIANTDADPGPGPSYLAVTNNEKRDRWQTDLPTYSSIVMDFVDDEPPKYEIVTGKKLNDELADTRDEERNTSVEVTVAERHDRCMKNVALILTLGVTIGVVVTVFAIGLFNQIRRSNNNS